MDLSLDDIITQTKGTRRGFGGGRGIGRGGRGRAAGGYRSSSSFGAVGRGIAGARRGQRTFSFNRRSGNPDGVWSHDKYLNEMGVATRRASGGMMSLNAGARGGAKLVIGNLDWAVSEADLRELFGEFGQILDATINYDMSGRSLGKADVTFLRRSSAQAVVTKYSGVPLDGRPMDIQWATPTGLSAAAPLSSRTLSSVAAGRVGTGRGGFNKSLRGAGVTRGRGIGSGRGRGARTATKTPTVEELDAELDAYVSQTSK